MLKAVDYLLEEGELERGFVGELLAEQGDVDAVGLHEGGTSQRLPFGHTMNLHYRLCRIISQRIDTREEWKRR